jgi:RimJ/RimL family protein N-acetyltransferase
MSDLNIVEISASDFPLIWPILEQVIREGETYPWPRDMTMSAAQEMWSDPKWRVFAALEDGACVGTYFIRPNYAGPASHIANAGYAVALTARGRGLAKLMCLHSLDRARESGYRAMQFNMVVSANLAAHAAWRACGFDDVGILKEAFNHPRLGYVDAHIMYRLL